MSLWWSDSNIQNEKCRGGAKILKYKMKIVVFRVQWPRGAETQFENFLCAYGNHKSESNCYHCALVGRCQIKENPDELTCGF